MAYEKYEKKVLTITCDKFYRNGFKNLSENIRFNEVSFRKLKQIFASIQANADGIRPNI